MRGKGKGEAGRIDLDREESNLGSVFKLERVDDRLSRKLKLIGKISEEKRFVSYFFFYERSIIYLTLLFNEHSLEC